jgi:ATP-dependent Zn protease
VAEEIVFSEDEVTTGASNDLQQIKCSCIRIVTEEQEAV